MCTGRACGIRRFLFRPIPESSLQQGANDMNTENKLARLMRNSGPARVLVPIGIILIVFGIVMFLFRPAGELVETVGTVTSVTEATADGDGKEYDVGFSYTVDGKEYQNVFSNLTGTFSIGDAIKVFYDSENPGNVANTKSGGFIAPVLIILGVLAIAYGISRSARAFKKSAELDQTAPGAGAPPVDFHGFKWLIQTTDYYPVDSIIGIRLNPDDIHIMKKSEYSGLYGDYSSYSEEYEELNDPDLFPEDISEEPQELSQSAEGEEAGKDE